MRLPDFRKIPLSLPLVAVLGLAEELGRVKHHLRKTYMELGGSRASQPYRSGDITSLREGIKEMLKEEVEKAYDEVREINPEALNKYGEAEGLYLDFGVCYKYSSPEYKKPSARVALIVEVIYVFHVAFLEQLQRERPRVYPLVRSIIHLMNLVGPVTNPTHVFEWMADRFEDEISYAKEQGAEEEEMRELHAEARNERDAYVSHVVEVKGSYPRLVRKVRDMHLDLGWELSPDENWFVRTALQFFEINERWGSRRTKVVHNRDSSGDEHQMENFFNLLYDPAGPISEDRERENQASGELSAPRLIFEVNRKADLKGVKAAVKSFILFEALMNGGGSIWTARKS